METHELHRLLLFCLIGNFLVLRSSGLGFNWGLRSTHPLPPNIVVQLMKDNGFNKVKLFEADHQALEALGNSGIEVMVGIPNEMLASLASNTQAALDWVLQNVSTFVSHNGVDIRYVAVGNEPFLKTYKDTYMETTFPALQNIQTALTKAGLTPQIKATVPLNADVYQSDTNMPSGGDFRSDIHDLMVSIITFLSNNNSTLTVNIYPFLSLNSDPNFPLNYAFFDAPSTPLLDGLTPYTNVFEANYDTLISALVKNRFGSMPVIVGEVGWPTDSDPNANTNNARLFNQGLVDRILQGKGTPRRSTPPEFYLFSLIDEDAKSIDPGNFERHWGVFYYDGSLKYELDLGSSRRLVPARGVKYMSRKWCVLAPQASLVGPDLSDSVRYACQFADCTSLGPGSSCSVLDSKGSASYAFNKYYQTMNQSPGTCQFNDLATITTVNPSQGDCRFEIQIDGSRNRMSRGASSSSASNMEECYSLMISVVLIVSCLHVDLF
ncbi:hypothetical protein V2J09_023614 [Rumex salicifolius]